MCLSSPNSTVDNTNSLNRTLGGLAERYYSILVVLSDFNCPKIDWIYCKTISNTNDLNLCFLEQSETVFCSST